MSKNTKHETLKKTQKRGGGWEGLSVSNDKDLMMVTTGRNMWTFDLQYNI